MAKATARTVPAPAKKPARCGVCNAHVKEPHTFDREGKPCPHREF